MRTIDEWSPPPMDTPNPREVNSAHGSIAWSCRAFDEARPFGAHDKHSLRYQSCPSKAATGWAKRYLFAFSGASVFAFKPVRVLKR
ncbi:hypothetical protein EVAR_71006_1 [Eumeta japonica]|uniref:Uncharacterized protein n=1 Tax=Eumeta variegata TaxID=151549 RepID=A0A4C2ABU6_EUMVA|nr:hypothetical protein EVAR_71006_1 [Eumeta japonica]